MADRIKQIPQKLLEIWKNWSVKQRIIIVSSIVAFIAVVGILAFVLTRPKYQVLVTCDDYTEMNSVTSLLSENNHKYKIDNMVVSVNEKELTACKMLLATEDIQSDGYTFEDAMKRSFTTTDSDSTKQYAHYLETKLASDLEDMDGVKSASVTINMPEKTNSFYQAASDATVAVKLTTTKDIGDDTAESMASLLAMAVGNDSTKSITIIDNKGNTLFNGAAGNSSTSGVGMNDKLKYKSQIEATTSSSLLRNILSTGLYDDAVITLNYSLDWNTVNKIAKEYTAQDGREEGLYSHIAQSGGNVSGGQKQRLCIARALLKKPKILILDDSTSAVDTATDASIRKALKEELEGMTTILIAQRVASVMEADKILVMENGKIRDMGNHETLMQQSDIYRELYESQQKGVE